MEPRKRQSARVGNTTPTLDRKMAPRSRLEKVDVHIACSLVRELVDEAASLRSIVSLSLFTKGTKQFSVSDLAPHVLCS